VLLLLVLAVAAIDLVSARLRKQIV
jgi:hypothetical protein